MKQETKPTSLQKKHKMLACRKCKYCRRTDAPFAGREMGTEIRSLYDAEAQSYWFYFSNRSKQ